MTSEIFISHADEDRARARHLAGALTEEGWSVWWDRDIPAGRTFEKVIEEQLNAAKCIVVMWSRVSVESDWVVNEATEGFERNVLVPVVIDDLPRVPLAFRRIQAASLADWRGQRKHPGFDKLVSGIAAILPRGPRLRSDLWHLPDEPDLGFVRIPQGPFNMGSDRAHDMHAQETEQPLHQVVLPTYFIARYPVTTAQFRTFAKDSGHRMPRLIRSRGLGDKHPIAWVDWHDAVAYGQWLNEKLSGSRSTPATVRELLMSKQWAITLPSEAEWEKAARGSLDRVFPWGNDPDPTYANYRDTPNVEGTSFVGRFSEGASPFGVEDLSGNVWEWTRSEWREYPYESTDGRESMSDEIDGRVFRGGSFTDERWDVRCAVRRWDSTDAQAGNIGFRMALSSTTAR